MLYIRRRVLLLALVSAGGLTLWFANRGDERPAPADDSHARMVRVLEAVRRKALLDNPYFETRSIDEHTRELSQLVAANSNEERQCGLHFLLADDYRRVGRIDLAVEHTLESERILDTGRVHLSPEAEQEIIYQFGVTFLRQGETENCVNCRTGESCILPIQGGGVHEQQIGSRTAMKYFERVLQLNPEHLPARWLLNVAAMTLGEFPDGVPESMRIPAESFRSEVTFPRFRDVARDVGLRIVDCGGAGIAEDFDNDGLIDILAATWDPGGQVHFLRNTGRGDFSDETEQAGLTGILGGINGVQADFDNDGFVDVFLVRGAWLAEAGRYPNSLLRNLGGGRFRDVTFELGLGGVQFPTSTAAWSDFDLDGDVDLFVGNESAPCQLFRNDGPDGFTDVAVTAGVTNDRFTKGAIWGDVDDDRRPDLYVSNLNGRNRLFHNNGDGTFTDVARELGVELPLHSFPTWFWDVNNDGRLDLYVASYEAGVEHIATEFAGLPPTSEPDCLYLNDGRGGFREAASEYGLTRITQPMGCNFGDLDNDGFPDFYMGTGYPELDAIMPNLMFHNLGGEQFEDVSLPGGFAHLQKGHGTAFADLDNDGDQDIFMQMGGAYPVDAFGNVLYENPGFGNHWIRLKLTGDASNQCGIGARIRVDVVDRGQRRSIYKWLNSGGSFGGSPLQPQIGLGQAERIETLEVYWPASDTRQMFHDLPVDRFVEIHEGHEQFRISELHPVPFRSGSPDENPRDALQSVSVEDGGGL